MCEMKFSKCNQLFTRTFLEFQLITRRSFKRNRKNVSDSSSQNCLPNYVLCQKPSRTKTKQNEHSTNAGKHHGRKVHLRGSVSMTVTSQTVDLRVFTLVMFSLSAVTAIPIKIGKFVNLKVTSEKWIDLC